MDSEIFVNQESVSISGSLNFKTVLKIWQQSLKLLPDSKKIVIDLKDVENCDSASLCLLIEWLKWAASKNKIISFKNLPSQLLTLAEIAGVSGLIKK